jgi:hypothetical protein
MLPDWLSDPGLLPLWRLVHQRLEQRGPAWRGRATLVVDGPAEQRALSLLLGRQVRGPRLTIDVGGLDELTTNAGGLIAVVTAAVGPVTDRRTERQQRVEQRDAPVRAAERRLGDVPWRSEWLSIVRRSQPTPAQAAAAAALLCRLLDGQEAVARQDLAAGLYGDAHALDDGTPISALVLRGLSLALDVPPAEHARARRELWEVVGVRLDAVSATALTHGLVEDTDGPRHVIAADLHRIRSPRAVLVCENPRILEAVAETGYALPVVCTSGNPNLVVLDVLSRLRSSSTVLHYHGDFDWAGLAIANRLVDAAGVQPWRMTTRDYREAPAMLRLSGRPVCARWDPTLSEAMAERGLAVHEEAVLPALLGQLGELA